MPPDKPFPKGSPAPIDGASFSDIIAKPSVARELLLPLGRARWEGERYTLERGDRDSVTPTISGVRFQEPDPNNVDIHREKGCQQDLVSLVRSVAEMRKVPQLGSLVLSDEVVIGTQAGNRACKRGLIGLVCPADGRFRTESEAAAECHRRIVEAGKKANFTLREEVPNFDPSSGFKGLAAWAERVRWQRARRKLPNRRWLLLLLLPLLLCLPMWCYRSQMENKPEELFNVPIETESVLILLDKSGSMKPCFPQVQDEAKRFLSACKNHKTPVYANVIVYDSKPTSVLHGLKPLTDENYRMLVEYLDALDAGNGTEFDKALDMAGEEIIKHGKKTTIMHLTDGNDHSKGLPIPAMIAKLKSNKVDNSILARFAGTGTVMRWRTPRLMLGGTPRPVKPEEVGWEDDLTKLAEQFNYRFGPSKDNPNGSGASSSNRPAPAGPDATKKDLD